MNAGATSLEPRDKSRPVNRVAPGGHDDPVPSSEGAGNLERLAETLDLGAGKWMQRFATELYPICRSITGAGIRQTLRRIREHIPLVTHEVRTGTRVFDWTIPREWNIRDAWVKNASGEKVIDFQKSNLHVVSYSMPIRRKVSIAELREHLHTLPEHPDWIPYRTTYYKETWGFCLTRNQLLELQDNEYEVCIDATLQDGSLSYGECYLPGKRSDEILLSCHVCHPSLCNDNLSGIALATQLAKLLSGLSLEYSYRFLFIPGTIGSIAWLARNEANVARIRHGLAIACVGDRGKFHFKRSRRGNTELDRAAIHALQHSGEAFEILDFAPYGYDERQYCSPGFNLAVGSLTRTPHGRFPEYHTSADNLDLIHSEALTGSLAAYLSVMRILENNHRYLNLNPKCEPQLGKRGLYRSLGGFADAGQIELAMLWVLNLSDGAHDLLDIAERSGLSFHSIHAAAKQLLAAHLLQRADEPAAEPNAAVPL